MMDTAGDMYKVFKNASLTLSKTLVSKREQTWNREHTITATKRARRKSAEASKNTKSSKYAQRKTNV